ncbi:universal stress protein [Nocardia cyriacigeorgica]|uniref:universal stress protein n=1 Tax=Nocardia cyriacigeorgica TaxID=135487 RepID=UPI000CEB59CE|nr:universal stress protein [Nocardia cyriacigeorgica]AVH24970.1 universal stress protein [Nocardia cyriacigeorgica]
MSNPRIMPADAPIVVAVDGSPQSMHAAAWAAADAASRGRPLAIVSSPELPSDMRPSVLFSADDIAGSRRRAEQSLERAADFAKKTEVPSVTTELIDGRIVPYLLARSADAVMIVVGSRGLGAYRRSLLGSVSTAVTRHAKCPVAVIRDVSGTDAVSAAKPVLVGVDGTRNSEPAIELAFDEASRRRVGLIALHAWTDVTGMDVPMLDWVDSEDIEAATLAEGLAGYSERYPDVEVRRVLERDRPARSLSREAENAQLVVLGSHGRGGFTGMLLGSTSESVLHSVDCPVIIVRG